MPYYFFAWTEKRIEYIAQHGVTPEEFEEIVCNPIATDVSHSSGRPLAIGYTSEGRKLVCIYEFLDRDTIFPINAFEPEEE